VTNRYTAESVKASVDPDRDRLFAPYALGRPENWSYDLRTHDLVCVGNWLPEELVRLGVNDIDRRTQQWKFNRLSRTYDVFESAAETLNEVLDGEVEQNRRPHRRWG
jgi:hypothetical protein